MQAAALKNYYASRFPVDALVSMLTRGGRVPLSSRETAFSWDGGQRFSRWRSFSTAQEFRDALIREVPERVEMGAAYAPGFAPGKEAPIAGRELCIDLDLPDFDDLRTCGCKGGPKTARCPLCWKLLSDCARAIDAVLRADFGFERVVWVYSGSKGLHAWVLDDAAFDLTQQEREELCARLKHPREEKKATMTQLARAPWPAVRLDEKVTTVMSHLIKLPFAVHQATKNVSVPLRADELDDPPRIRADGEDCSARSALLSGSSGFK